MLLGLSILIASVSFIFYRQPLGSVLQWFRRPFAAPRLTKADGDGARETDEAAGGEPKHEVTGVPDIVFDSAAGSTGGGEHTAELQKLNTTDGHTSEGRPETPRAPHVENEGAQDDGEGWISISPPTGSGESTPTQPDRPPPIDFPAPKVAEEAKSMPPPALPSSRPSPLLSVNRDRGSSSNKQLDAPDTYERPMFPAANSAQRASSPRGPPRLNPIPSSSLMAPPARLSPLPNRSPTGGGLAPPPTHSAIPSKPRKKVLLTPGHSPLDWARFASSAAFPHASSLQKIPPSLLAKYTGRKGKDAWTALGGKVYNISPYAAYHPGGEPELMKCAGRDGTRLFGEVHPWVNWEGMLEGCLVGVLVAEGETARGGGWEEMD